MIYVQKARAKLYFKKASIQQQQNWSYIENTITFLQYNKSLELIVYISRQLKGFGLQMSY